MPRSPIVEIHYRRPPDRLDIYHQVIVRETPKCVVTRLDAANVKRPLVVAGEVVLEPGSPIVWFTYPGRWYDIGRFHRADGRFTGWYANVLTPVEITPPDPGVPDSRLRWETTDLFLDVWLGVDGTLALLDEDEFQAAITAGWIDPPTAAIARATAESLLARAARCAGRVNIEE